MENNLSLLRRLNIYQKERFPVLAHGLLITAFTFSAIAYSRICRGIGSFISTKDFLIGIFASFTLFLLVRIFDEFKDQEDDAKYRKYLPVPRGLVSLKELASLGWIIAIIQIAVIGFFQTKMLFLYALVLVYLLLMSKEFFIPEWLKKHQIAYILSHMMIIPLIDLYSSGLDWLLAGDVLHKGVFWFMAVSFVNGIVLEFGRKIKTPSSEEEGVVSYTKLYGTKRAVAIWISLLATTTGLAIGAANYASYGQTAIGILISFFTICSVPAILFLLKPTVKKAKWIEYASGAWTILMYLSLGAIPMIKTLMA